MKSKFAKFTDATLGAAMIFFAATAVLRYYTTLELAAFSAAAITACVVLMLGFVGKRKAREQIVSKAAQDMFFDFMFLDDAAPARLLHKGLKAKNARAALHGKGVYLNGTAAFCLFDAPLDAKKAARLISKAKHYGAKKVVALCKVPPQSTVDIDGFSIKTVCGDDVYRLFASLGCLPDRRFSSKNKSRFAALRGALGGDKIIKYLLLCVTFFAIAAFTGYSVIMLVCASACGVLFMSSATLAIIKRVKGRRRQA